MQVRRKTEAIREPRSPGDGSLNDRCSNLEEGQVNQINDPVSHGKFKSDVIIE